MPIRFWSRLILFFYEWPNYLIVSDPQKNVPTEIMHFSHLYKSDIAQRRTHTYTKRNSDRKNGFFRIMNIVYINVHLTSAFERHIFRAEMWRFMFRVARVPLEPTSVQAFLLSSVSVVFEADFQSTSRMSCAFNIENKRHASVNYAI